MSEAAAAERGAGSMLRAARERQGLHIAALAAAIKVSQRKLEALEADRFDELPDATFTRALAQTVCRQLKIDPRPVLDLLPQPAHVALEPASGGLNTPFRERASRDDAGMGGLPLRPVLLAAAVLVGGAAAVYFLPPGLLKPRPAATPPVAQAPQPEPVAMPVPVAPPDMAASAPVFATAPEAPASAAATEAARALPAASAPPAPAPALAQVAAAPAAPATQATPGPSPVGVVQLRSSAASWVEARDARGQVLLSRTVQAGEALGLDGKLPIRMTIGNAAATQVGFRGQPVDLAPRTRDNVARLELQ